MKEVIAISLTIIAITIMLSIACDKKSCLTKYADFQPEYHGIVTGCLVQYNGKTIPAESLRVME